MHAAHLSRKLQHSVTAMRSGEGLPPDLLTPAAVDTRFIGAAGFPDLADSVAYDPSQGLLAVGAEHCHAGCFAWSCGLRARVMPVCAAPGAPAQLAAARQPVGQLALTAAARNAAAAAMHHMPLPCRAVASRHDTCPQPLLLQVGTSDGRVVLLGRPGVEATLRSPSRSPTQHLCFLPGKGGLLRVTQVHLGVSCLSCCWWREPGLWQRHGMVGGATAAPARLLQYMACLPMLHG